MASSGVPQVEIVMTSPTATHGTGAAGSGLSFESPAGGPGTGVGAGATVGLPNGG